MSVPFYLFVSEGFGCRDSQSQNVKGGRQLCGKRTIGGLTKKQLQNLFIV